MGLLTLVRAVPLAALILGSPAFAMCQVFDVELAAGYRGECQAGLAEGRGHAFGRADYRGEFRAGRKHGEGIKTWPDGERYQGQFEDDRKHGPGSYTWGATSLAPGARYVGEFAHDQRHGRGLYISPEGQKLEAEWREDTPITPLTAQWQAYAVSQQLSAQLAAPGSTLCREIPLGHSSRDTVIATVASVEGLQAQLIIHHPGEHPHQWGGVRLAKGARIQTSLAGWRPCRF